MNRKELEEKITKEQNWLGDLWSDVDYLENRIEALKEQIEEQEEALNQLYEVFNA